MIKFKNTIQEGSQLVPEPTSLSNEKYSKFIVNYINKQREIFHLKKPMTQSEFIKSVDDKIAKHFLNVTPVDRI